MLNASKSMNYASLDQQIVHLQAVIEEIQGTLLRVRLAALPEQFYEDVHKIADGIAQLRYKVNLLEEERLNLSALAEVMHFKNTSLALDDLLQIVMDTIIRITGAERAFLMLRDREDNMVIRLGRNWEQETLDSSEPSFSRTVVQRVVEDGKSVLTTNAQEDRRFGDQKSVQAKNLLSVLCVPLFVKDQMIGVIYADHRIRAGLFTRKTLDLLVGFAGQVAAVIESSRLLESVERSLAEVTELKNLMDNVLGSITSAVLTVSTAGVVTLCNPAAENLLGRTAQEMIGKKLNQIIPEIDPSLARGLVAVINRQQRAVTEEIAQALPGRGRVEIRFDLSLLKDKQGTVQGVTIVLEDLSEQKRLEAQQRLFERMISPGVIEQLDPDSLHLGGRRAEITVLFADLRDFTGFSEGIPPEELVRILNCYLAAAADAVLHEGGTVDKFLGDAVMAWFNAPVLQPDHTLRAVRAALGIQAAVEKLHEQLSPRHHLSFGVGIHTGEAVLGLVGSEKRLDYTAIGDSVNTARRLQENAGPGQILISHDAFLRVATTIRAFEVDAVIAKGKRDVISAYEVFGLC